MQRLIYGVFGEEEKMTYRALLTGGTGFIGGYLARCLLDDGWQLSAVVRTSSNVEFLSADMKEQIAPYNADRMELRDIVGEAAPDVVFYLAAY